MDIHEVLVPVEPYHQLVINVEPGTHTIVIDEKLRTEHIITEFINEIFTRCDGLSSNCRDDIIALAIGLYGFSVKSFFETVNQADINDRILANIVRYHMERLANGKEN